MEATTERAYTSSRADSIVRAGEDYARDIPRVFIPEDWAREMRAYKLSAWRENYGHAHGETPILEGEMARRAATIWLASGAPRGHLVWVDGHGGTTVSFLEYVPHRNGFRFCG